MSGTGSSTGAETNSDDMSLNDLSANHNNDLFAGAVASTCVDALAHISMTTDSIMPDDWEPTAARPKEDTEYLLGSNNEYQAPVGSESANLWSKAITTLAKGKSNKTSNIHDSSYDIVESDDRGKGRLSAYDMSQIIDGSIHGGEKPAPTTDNQRKSKIVASSEFSIDGESAILWGDDPEKAYFAYMLEQEAENRAREGKDTDDSLMAESTKRELLQGVAGVTPNFAEEDDTTLGNPSKVFGGWDPSTVAGPSKVSSLTPSSQQKLDKDGRLIIPNVIYVQDGAKPNSQEHSRNWDDHSEDEIGKRQSNKSNHQPEQAREKSSRRHSNGNKSKAATKHLEDEEDDHRVADEATQRLMSGLYANRLMIGSALFFLVLATGLVVALILYRNHAYAEDTNTAFLDENGNPIVMPPSTAPALEPSFAPWLAPSTPYPTIDLFKKKDYDNEDEDDDDEAEPEFNPTKEPTWYPTDEPVLPSTEPPSESPTNRPTKTPSTEPTEAPSMSPTAFPTQSTTAAPTETISEVPTETMSESPTESPSFNPTRMESDPPTSLSESPTKIPLPPATLFPSDAPSIATPTPSMTPSAAPTDSEIVPMLTSNTTIVIISNATTVRPTSSPTRRPTRAPSEAPSSMEQTVATTTENPTTEEPSGSPTRSPTTPAPTSRSPTTPAPTSRSPTTPAPTSRSPTPLPTPLPTSLRPTTAFPASVPPYVALDTVRSFLLEYSPSSGRDMFNAESSQYKALVWLANWMASIPPQDLGRFTKRRLVQRWSLAVLYLELNGPDWVNGSDDWMSDKDSCDWLRDNNQGSCDEFELALTLDLSSNNLRGSLPKEIALLENLTRLEVDRNDIMGPLPQGISKLTRLVSLDFTRCDLTGKLPSEIGVLQSLAILGLGRNDLTGTLPTEIGLLSNLVYLGLERNDVRGTIPLELTSLVNLEYLALDWNAFSGSVPSELSALTNLQTLILARNSLVGSVPNAFCTRPMDFLAADCEEVNCLCCDLCCVNGAGCAST